jgi:hypothetical protein
MLLERRSVGFKTIRERGLLFYEYAFHFPQTYLRPAITFASVATHNHFALKRGGSVFKQSSPVVQLPATASEGEYLALLGLLNASIACFWMKQVFHCKGSQGINEGMKSQLWEQFFDHDATKMALFPVVEARAETVPYSSKLDAVARARTTRSERRLLDASTWQSGPDLRRALDERRKADFTDLTTMIALQEELDWLCYGLYGLESASDVVVPEHIEACPPTWLPWNLTFAERDAQNRKALTDGEEPDEQPSDWWTRHGWEPLTTLPKEASPALKKRIEARRARTAATPALALIETANFKRRWYKPDYAGQERVALKEWLADRVEQAAKPRTQAFSLEQLVANLQDDARVLAVCEVLTDRKDFSLSQLVASALQGDAVPNHRFHLYKPAGLVKREAWERIWADQRREDAGEKVTPEVPPAYGSGDFLKPDYWRLRGKLDVPKERFIVFTEVPGRAGVEVLYGWAGWSAQQRMKAVLVIDEELEDASVALADRIGLLDSAWRLLPDAAREDAAIAARLKAELQALLGLEGPSAALIDDWKKRFPASARASGAPKTSTTVIEEESSDDLPLIIPEVSEREHAAILVWALLHASGGTATRLDLARGFALHARPALLKKLAPASLKREVAHWVATVGSRSVKAGLLASTLSELASRNGVSLGTDSEGRAIVSTSPQTPTEEQIDAWFLFEADLALRVLRAQPVEKFSAIDKALTGADRKLLEVAG